MQRRLEEQLRKVRVQDLLLESVASIINLSARRIAKQDERDLEQARVGIEAVRALLDLLEPEPRGQVREALSQVQMLYAREAQGGGEAEPAAAPGAGEGGEGPPGGEGTGGPGAPPGAGQAPPPRRQGEPPPRLWTPPGST